ncbi:hypothetical protein TorRG33x02_338030 [Trema orientale]|uniref:Uncharacterized protein n=1 Tax=Trema orientale TaxID=63057 RepID=A0A2P5AY68_TREOI|nr:hypothetical protein TorRG33x02_338030 [Trema orientale]
MFYVHRACFLLGVSSTIPSMRLEGASQDPKGSSKTRGHAARPEESFATRDRVVGPKGNLQTRG